jgi:hypothetical protein
MNEPAVNGVRIDEGDGRGPSPYKAVGPLSLDRMGPILRDLVSFGLVERTETGRFELREDVQRWLAEAFVRSGPPGTAEVFVGRQCQRCGNTGVTRLVEGIRICASCQATPVAEVVPDEPLVHHARWRRARKAG